MAVTKIIGSAHVPSKGNKYAVVKNMIEYVENPAKTQGGLLTGYQNCIAGQALENFIDTYKFYRKEPKNCHDRLANHWTISWKADCKISADIALEITREFVKELLDRYEVVYGVHTDQPHIHSHIVFNHVSYVDGYKFRYENDDWEKKIQPVTDRLCQRYGFNTLEMDLLAQEELQLEEIYEAIEERKKMRAKRRSAKRSASTGNAKNRSKHNYYNDRNEPYKKADHMRLDIDCGILQSSDYEEFLQYLKNTGYKVKDGKHLSILGAGMERYRRTYILGKEYSKENIIRRIAAKSILPEVNAEPDSELYFEQKLDKIGKIVFTEDSRKHYAEQYRAGLLKPGQNRAYYVVRKALKEKQKRERIELFLKEKGIRDVKSAKTVLKEYPKKIEDAKQKKKIFYDSILPYQQILKEYESCIKLKKEYEYYLEDGNQAFLEAYQQYYTFLEHLEHYEMTLEELADFAQQVREEKNYLRREVKELQKEQMIIIRYMEEMGEDVSRYLENDSIHSKTDIQSGQNPEMEHNPEVNQNQAVITNHPDYQAEGLLDITINEQLVAQETDDGFMTRVPGTWGKHVRYMWIQKCEMQKVHEGKSIFTSLKKEQQYALYDENNQIVEYQNGEQLYTHYNEVDSSNGYYYRKYGETVTDDTSKQRK